MKPPKDDSSLKFETVMENLQAIVQEMEKGDLPLDNLIARYEEGMRLVKISRDKLAQAEQKIEVLTKNHEAHSPLDTPPISDPALRAPSRDEVSLF